MARNPKHDILFEPIRIGPKVLKNRFYQVPQCNGLGSDRPGAQAYNRALKIEGGWAAVSTEACSIHAESDVLPSVTARLWDDGDIGNLSAMTDMVHERGGLAGVELWYAPHSPNQETRNHPFGATQIGSGRPYDIYPQTMDKRDIRRFQNLYVNAAKRAKVAGFDIVYLYGSHAQGPYQFLSPVFNRRTDEYGGSFQNRARFWKETLEMLKEAIGDDCAVASRFSVDSLGNAGIDVDEDGIGLIEHVDDLVDLWDLTVGVEFFQDAVASRFLPENYYGDLVGRIKRGGHTKKPVVGVGRFTNPDTMAEVIRSSQLDIIGAARPSIADPFLPKKIEEGRLDDIRECIGCNVCISKWEIGTPIICTQNATQGEEYRRGWHPEKFHTAKNADKAVLIVGAGPSGLEAATVLGKRGMEAVHVVEATDEIGGHLKWVSRLGHGDGADDTGFHEKARGLGEWRRVIDYRRAQIDKLSNVEVILNTRLTAEQVREYGADIVIVATGCRWVADGINSVTHAPIPGADSYAGWLLTPDQVATESRPVGQRVVVMENESYYVGVSVAQKLAGEGHDVTLLTQHPDIAAYMGYTLEQPLMRRELQRLGVTIKTGTMIESLRPGRASIYSVWGPGKEEDVPFDSVVLCTSRSSNDQLYQELRADPKALGESGIQQLHIIGDASAPRLLADSIFDGHRLAREIDSSDPRVPLPFIRERRMRGSYSPSDYESQLEGERDSGAPPSEI